MVVARGEEKLDGEQKGWMDSKVITFLRIFKRCRENKSWKFSAQEKNLQLCMVTDGNSIFIVVIFFAPYKNM